MQQLAKKATKMLFEKRLYLIGGVLGAIGGYVYWYFWGCEEACTISSSPINSSLYGMLMGGLLLSMFSRPKVADSKTEA